jgi:ferric-dicitrate binding protein FerR (iron transport regulator)
MPALLTSLDDAQVAAFHDGDEHAFERLVHARFDALTDKARQKLGDDAIGAPRVAMYALLGAWNDRARFTSAHAIDDYFDDAVPHLCADELRRRAALHRFEKHEGVHAHAAARPAMTAAQAWDEIAQRLHVSAEDVAAHREEARRIARRHAREHVDTVATRRIPTGAIITGVVLLVAAVGLVKYMDRGSAELALTRALEATDARILRSSPGQRGTVSLRDASTAQMGAATTLRIPREFGTSVRGLALDGASRFVVSAGGALPFQVRAKGAAIVATGTDFVVRAYEDEADVLVTVREGSVRVHPRVGDGASRTLAAGEAVVVTAEGAFREPTQREVELAFSWVDGALRLDDVTLDQALRTLRRWHALEATLADATLGQRRVSTTLSLASDAQALDSIMQAAQLVVTYDGQERILRDVNDPAAKAAPVKR